MQQYYYNSIILIITKTVLILFVLYKTCYNIISTFILNQFYSIYLVFNVHILLESEHSKECRIIISRCIVVVL